MPALDELDAVSRRGSSRSTRRSRKVKAQLDPAKTLIGFAGSPWTVATYMVAGQGSRDQAEARRLAYARSRARSARSSTRIEAVTLDYLSGQIEAGAEAVQLFDSWAGSLSPAQFERWVIAPTARLVAALQERHPDSAGHRLSQGRRRQARALMRARRASTRSASTRPSIRSGPRRSCPTACRSRAISIRWR